MSRHRRIVIVALSVLLITPSAFAAYFDGFFALDTGDYETAYNEWREAASAGDAQSMGGLGGLYEEGLGVERDDVMALVYYEIATVLGDTEARAKRNRVRRRLNQTELDETNAIIAEVKSSGRLPPKVRKPSAASATQSVVVESESTSGAGAETVESETTAATADTNLGPRAKIVDICRFKLSWRDQGSGGARDVALHAPKARGDVWVLGDYGQNDYNSPTGCVRAIQTTDSTLVQPPAGWELIWWDKGSGADMDGSLWRAKAPSDEYVCLGTVAQRGYQAPTAQRYGCVHICMIAPSPLNQALWDDRGTNARKPVNIHRLAKSGVITAFAGRNAPKLVDDLDTFAACLGAG